jgi:hypothetical protein
MGDAWRFSTVAEFANPLFQDHLVIRLDPRKYNSNVTLSRGVGAENVLPLVVILILSLVPAGSDLLAATPQPYKLKSVARP